MPHQTAVSTTLFLFLCLSLFFSSRHRVTRIGDIPTVVEKKSEKLSLVYLYINCCHMTVDFSFKYIYKGAYSENDPMPCILFTFTQYTRILLFIDFCREMSRHSENHKFFSQNDLFIQSVLNNVRPWIKTYQYIMFSSKYLVATCNLSTRLRKHAIEVDRQKSIQITVPN